MKTLFCFLLSAIFWTAHAAGPCGFIGTDAQTISWIRRTGSPGISVGTQIAATCWMRDVRAGGLYPGKIYRRNLFAGNLDLAANNLGAVGHPIIADQGHPSDLSVEGNTSLSAWIYSERGSSGGLKQNGSPGNYIDTGITPSSVFTSVTNAHLAAYVTVSDNATDTLIGGYPNTTDSSRICALYVSSASSSYSWLFSISTPASASDSAGVGYYVGTSQLGSNTLWKAGSLLARSASGGNLSAIPSLYVFCMHAESPATLNFTLKTMGGYEIGTSYSDADVAISQTADQRFQSALGRQH